MNEEIHYLKDKCGQLNSKLEAANDWCHSLTKEVLLLKDNNDDKHKEIKELIDEIQ